VRQRPAEAGIPTSGLPFASPRRPGYDSLHAAARSSWTYPCHPAASHCPPCFLLCAPSIADEQKLPPAVKRKVDFVKDVEPILNRSCVGCHGADKTRGSLRLDDGKLALLGGDSGVVIRPGRSDRSLLIQLVAGVDAERSMPPEGRKKLTAEEVGVLRAWIDQGAAWPAKAAVVVKKSSHWAFQPVRRPALPAVTDRAWPSNGIDAFVLARLQKEKITPSPEADVLTLMRRAHLDLTGPAAVARGDRLVPRRPPARRVRAPH